MFTEVDIHYMRQALQLAESAAKNNEVPVGAVLVHNDQVIGQGCNQPICTHDPAAHAEIIALRNGAETLKNYRLVQSTLYVTLEPCVMCIGAIVHARIERVIYGAADPKTGAVTSMFQLGDSNKFNHQVKYLGGLLAEDCSEILKKFFRARR